MGKKISLVLDKYLTENNISQYELIKRTQITPPTIRAYYRNTLLRYDVEVLEKICTALNCDISDIIKCVDVAEASENKNK